MNSNKSTLPITDANFLYHLSDTEEENAHSFLDEPIYKLFRNLHCYSFSFQPVSMRKSLNEIQNDCNYVASVSKHRGYRSVKTSLTENKAAKLLFSKSVERSLAHEPINQPKLKIPIRCSSLKRLSAQELCTSYIFLQTFQETKKMVFFLAKQLTHFFNNLE